MSKNEILLLNNQIYEKRYKEYKIKLTPQLDKLNISIQQHNSFDIYESYFNLEYLLSFQLFISKKIIQQIMKFICDLIEENNIKIEINDKNLKLILISTTFTNVELILKKKNYNSNEVIEKLINEFKIIKNENKYLKECNDKLTKRIELIENVLKNKDNKIDNIDNNKINEIEKRINKLELFHKDKNKIQLTNCNLKNINSIEQNDGKINSLSIFPSGNIISVTGEKSIIIYDIHLNLMQQISNAHESPIAYINVKDENNFITCSVDKSIKLWIKKQNQFIINQIIKNAHEDSIRKVIYYLNGDLISCSYDKSIKIWKINNNKYENIVTLVHLNCLNSILLLEDKKMLISSGRDGTKIWDLNKDNYKNINCIKYFEDTFCGWNNSLCRLDEDKIIIGGKGNGTMKIISISKKEIIKEINNIFQCWGICLIEDKGIFLVGGESKDIKIYRNDNYECIQIIKNAHKNDINGFIEMKDSSIASFSDDMIIKIWNFE